MIAWRRRTVVNVRLAVVAFPADFAGARVAVDVICARAVLARATGTLVDVLGTVWEA